MRQRPHREKGVNESSGRVCGVNDARVMAIEFRAQLYRCAKQATARAAADVDARSMVDANAR